MADEPTGRGIRIGMGIAVLAGVAISFLVTTVGDWELSDWIFNLAGVILAIVFFAMAAQGRQLPGRLAPQGPSARRVRGLAILSIIAFAFVLLIFVGAELTGAFEPTDGTVAGLLAAALVYSVGLFSSANKALKSES